MTNWTPRMDRDLDAFRAVNVPYYEIAAMLGCTREEAIARVIALRRGGGRPAVGDVGAVPRPPAPRRAGLIDLSAAPSSVEEQAKRWAGR